MMKKLFAALMAAAMCASMAACGAAQPAAAPVPTAEPTAEPVVEATAEPAEPMFTGETLRIAGLKGPTTMGLVNMIEDDTGNFELSVFGAADEIVPLLMKGELDAAAIPANLAATLYQKTEGAIEVVGINTLGVLYMVELADNVHSVADLAGQTILTTGKGTTPEYILRYILTENGLDPDKEVTIEYYSEATEVAARMMEPSASSADLLAMLPQPFATTVLMQAAQAKTDGDEGKGGPHVVLDMTEEWRKVADTNLVTGVMVVRKEIAENRAEDLAFFLQRYAESVTAANEDVEKTAALCEQYGIVAKAAVAQKALPLCNIVLETGEEMKADLQAYYQVLFDANPASVGGALPGDAFYYAG